MFLSAQSLLPDIDAPTGNDNRAIDQPLEEDRENSRYGKTKQLTAELIQWLVNKVKADDASVGLDTAKNLLKHANIVKMDKPTAWGRVPMEMRMTGYKYLEEKLVPAGIPMDRCIGYWCARLMLCKSWETPEKESSATNGSQQSTGAETPVEVPADEPQDASRAVESSDNSLAQHSLLAKPARRI
ncbi:hypothetical protein EC973_004935 [Apophysomyces ossiformis]|uniref:Uncharacterized protein n=1 Tax=Apophysomyces ossiformis TaxID=679940 RepID=A0A8H7BPR8_9FUNG|nr:hypothetical protein EC973_004935 [Apophysomyces ossiformis]